MRGPKLEVVYATSSDFKIAENEIFRAEFILSNGMQVRDQFSFEVRQVSPKEVLEVDLDVMVEAEVVQAYAELRVPCIVEHAGLVFDDYRDKSYPGGLTKPMWNALGDAFCEEVRSQGRRVAARAVVGYCDGMSVRTFSAETKGSLADSPRGSRQFYWDTVFVPDPLPGTPGGLTYAEIVEDPALGLRHKVLNLSQSSKAMEQYLLFRLGNDGNDLWAVT